MARMQRISIASLACVTALQSSGIVWPCRRDGFEGFEYENGEKEEDNYKFMHVLLVLPLLLSVHPLLVSGSFYYDYALECIWSIWWILWMWMWRSEDENHPLNLLSSSEVLLLVLPTTFARPSVRHQPPREPERILSELPKRCCNLCAAESTHISNLRFLSNNQPTVVKANIWPGTQHTYSCPFDWRHFGNNNQFPHIKPNAVLFTEKRRRCR